MDDEVYQLIADTYEARKPDVKECATVSDYFEKYPFMAASRFVRAA